eukprot:2394975-Pyramimonas_sp.AAC.1
MVCRVPSHHCHRESAPGRTRTSAGRLLGCRASQVPGHFSLPRGLIGLPMARSRAKMVATG